MLKKVIGFTMVVCLLMGVMTAFSSTKSSAESTDVYQVNGKYKVTSSRLTTYCRLEAADSGLKKKTRTFKITSKTKFQRVDENRNCRKTTLKKSKIPSLIRRLNRTGETIQFKMKSGKVLILYYNI